MARTAAFATAELFALACENSASLTLGSSRPASALISAMSLFSEGMPFSASISAWRA